MQSIFAKAHWQGLDLEPATYALYSNHSKATFGRITRNMVFRTEVI